jgi:hypothetical protein
MKALGLGLLRLYKRWISPAFPPSCRYVPTCSEYAMEAVERYGVLRGGMMAAWRVLRCHPLATGGLDPVVKSGAVEPAAEKGPSAPKGAVDSGSVSASLKRCPDTNRHFSAACVSTYCEDGLGYDAVTLAKDAVGNPTHSKGANEWGTRCPYV